MATEDIAITFGADIKNLIAGLKRVEEAIEKVKKKSTEAATEEERNMKKREAAAKRATRQMEALHKSQLAAAKGMASGMMGTLGNWAAGFGMTAGFVKAIDDIKEFDAALTDLRINGDKSAAWAKKMEKAISAVSSATGRSRMETLEYARAIIVQTGNAEVAMKTLSQMGDVALATGADFKSLGGVAVKLTGAMGISSEGTELRRAFSTLHTQGKLGSIEFRAQSSELGRLFAVSAMLGKVGQGQAGVAGVGALFQLAARGKTPEQAGEVATSVERFLERLTRDPAKIEAALGIQLGSWQGGAEVQRLAKMIPGAKNTIARKKILDKIFKAGGSYQYNDMEAMARAIGELGARDPGKFSLRGTELFGIEGVRVAQQLAAAARGGWGSDQGSLTAASTLFGAGGNQVGWLRGTLSGQADIIAEDAEIRRKSLSTRWDVTMQKFAHTMHGALLPVFEALVKKGDMLAAGFKFLVKNFEYLLAAMATYKTVSAFGQWSGGGAAAAGAAGAAGGMGGAAAGAGFSLGRAAANAFAFAPVMATLGWKLGEWMAGGSIAKVKAEEAKTKSEVARGKILNKQSRDYKKNLDLAKYLSTEYYTTTGVGANLDADTAKLLAATNIGGAHLAMPGAGSMGALEKAQKLHAARVAQAEEAARLSNFWMPSMEDITEAGGPGSEAGKRMLGRRESMLARIDPKIAELGAAVKSLDQAAANFVTGKIAVPVVVKVQYPGNLPHDPGERMKRQSGRSGNAMDTDGTLDDVNFGTDQGSFGATSADLVTGIGGAFKGLGR